MITQERLRELLHYDPETGVFTWRLRHANCMPIGSVAGTLKPSGYREVKINGRLYKEHRLAWLYVHGVWPAAEIDHRHGVTSDNRIDELREALHSQNARNRKRNANNTSGYKGVSYFKNRGDWVAQIQHAGVRRHLGYFATPEAAHAAYEAAATTLFGAFKRAA